MLTDSEKETIQDAYRRLSQTLPNFRPRPAQRTMIAHIANTFARACNHDDASEPSYQSYEHIAMIEGPTGVGKSLAYLLAGTMMALSRGKKLIVSSATIALQEQLVQKDIPKLLAHGEIEATFALAKGRERYLCPLKLKQKIESPLATQHDFFMPQKKRPPETWFQQLFNAFNEGTWNGDRDQFETLIPDEVWEKLTNNKHGCLKNMCTYRKECPFFLARESLEDVDIIVANHNLVLADLALGGGTVLPDDPAHCFYCFDEAHHLSEKAIQQFTATQSLDTARYWCHESMQFVEQKLAPLFNKDDSRIQQSLDTLTEVSNELSQLNNLLLKQPKIYELILTAGTNLASYKHSSPPTFCFPKGEFPPELELPVHNMSVLSKQLFKHFEFLNAHLASLRQDPAFPKEQLDALSAEFSTVLSLCERFANEWNVLTQIPTHEHAPPIAKWCSVQFDEQKRAQLSLSASFVSAAHHLKKWVWNRCLGVVLTSATLRSLNSFQWIQQQLGLSKLPPESCLVLDSPFDFAKQGELYLAPMKFLPNKSPDDHRDEIIERLPSLISANEAVGTLVLFTAKKQMNEVFDALKAPLKPLILMQHQEPKHILLKKHQQQLNEGKPSILFGLDAFAEGLDLPHELCVHVIIVKLPFNPPDDPVEKTHAQWINERGGNAFFELTVPAASIKLIQAVGRLIRTESDYGRVTILDRRLQHSSYGQKMLAALPPLRRI